MPGTRDEDDRVGPVLTAGETADAIVRAIRTLNDDVSVTDRGAYVRVSVPRRCVLTRASVEHALGRAFELPGELERVMPSFKGRLSLSDEDAVWEWRGAR